MYIYFLEFKKQNRHWEELQFLINYNYIHVLRVQLHCHMHILFWLEFYGYFFWFYRKY